MPLPSRTRALLTAGTVLLLGAVAALYVHVGGGPDQPSTAPVPAETDGGVEAATAPLPAPEPERGVLEVTLQGAEGAAQVWVTGLNVWPARLAHARAGQATLRIAGLPEGEVHLWARTPTQVAGPSPPLAVTESESARATLALTKAAALRGHVETTSGNPLTGALVAVLPPEPGMPRQELVTDDAGDFAGGLFFEPVAHLWVQAEGYVDEVVEARPEGPLRIVMEPTCTVRGQVHDERGQPVPEARVWAEGEDGQPVRTTWRNVLDPSAGELGVVRGDIPRVPLAMVGAQAAAQDARTTNARGAFELPGLRCGSLRVSAEASGFARATRPVARGDLDAPLTLVLHEGGRVFGTVRDPRGYEVPGIDVRLLEQSTRTQHWTASDGHGEFHFEGVRGPVQVSAYEHGTLASRCDRRVQAGDAIDCALTVGQPRATLTLEVEDDRGQPVPGALVQLIERSGGGAKPLSRRRLTDPGGEAVFAALPLSSYQLLLSATGYVTPQPRELTTAEDTTLPLRLVHAGEVAGSVVDSLGRAVPNARVHALGLTTEAFSTADGSFVLEGLPPGDVTLEASHGTLESDSTHTRVHAEERVGGLVLYLNGRANLEANEPASVASDDQEDDLDTQVDAGTPEPEPEPEPSLLEALELTSRNGQSVVAAVGAGSEAARAGFRPGDVLTHVDGEQVLTVAQARGMLRDPPGARARVRVRRGSRSRVLSFRRPALR